MSVRKAYIVTAPGMMEEFSEYESAARHWDRSFFNVPAPVGGIMVQEYRDDVMVRDGWVVKVSEDGSVYINPLGA